MKKTILLASLLTAVISLASAQQKISILGDSYSTFGGYISPATNLAWYNGSDGEGKTSRNDVKEVDQTWWRLLAASQGYEIEQNNSFSGSTVCCTGYRGDDYSDRAFIVRALNLGNPDIILVFGGTNDSWAGAPIGEFQYADWTKADLYSFRPAFAYLMQLLTMAYPQARIYNITNSELSDEVTSSMADICAHYGVTNILLHDIDKQMGHPSIAGMKSIAEQVEEAILAEVKSEE